MYRHDPTPPRWRHGRKLLLPVGPPPPMCWPATDPECAGVGVVLEAADWVSMAVACPDCCDAAAVLEGVSPARSLGADASSSPASFEPQASAKPRSVVFKRTHIVNDSWQQVDNLHRSIGLTLAQRPYPIYGNLHFNCERRWYQKSRAEGRPRSFVLPAKSGYIIVAHSLHTI